MDFLTSVFGSIQRNTVGWMTVFTFIAIIELATSRSPEPWRTWPKALMYWAVSIPLATFVEAICLVVRDTLGIQPVLVLGTSDKWYAFAVIFLILAATLYDDFIFYWVHRAQHRWFWRWHAVHHSIRDLNGINSYHHISEAFIRTTITLVPASLLTVNVGEIAPLLMLAFLMQSVFLHSSSAWNLGHLRAVFGDNSFHRIHHSMDPRHFDRNFGASTTIWDRLFGTAYWPAPDEWPDTGVVEADEPRTMGEWLFLPWRLERLSTSALSSQQVADVALSSRSVSP